LHQGLSDRQAAEAVRSRIDLKYALSLELDDPGFDFSVLCEFRARLLAGGRDQNLLEVMLEHLHQRGLVKARGKQRTDSTHVLAAVRSLNRLEFVGETMRAALNAVATSAPQWLIEYNRPDWLERYGARVEQYRLPRSLAARQSLAEVIGADGHDLLAALFEETKRFWLCRLPAVERLRIVWIQQFRHDQGQVRWREPADQPPVSQRLHSPYDPDVRYARKRETGWIGYKVHLTETCDTDMPNLITDVQTTAAGLGDVEMTAPVQDALTERGLPPETHLVDAGYVDAALLISSQAEHAIELLGPVLPDSSWRARNGQGFDLGAFTILWDKQVARCPVGQTSRVWEPGYDEAGAPVVRIRFSLQTCGPCPHREQCSRSTPGGRITARRLVVYTRSAHEALQARRLEQNSESWKKRYACRAGIEGTLSQGVRRFGLRRCRYLGKTKTHLQHIFTAVAMNLARLDARLRGEPRAQTRQSRLSALTPGAACDLT
jgi:transposase